MLHGESLQKVLERARLLGQLARDQAGMVYQAAFPIDACAGL